MSYKLKQFKPLMKYTKECCGIRYPIHSLAILVGLIQTTDRPVIHCVKCGDVLHEAKMNSYHIVADNLVYDNLKKRKKT
jgi:hypothetical protein